MTTYAAAPGNRRAEESGRVSLAPLAPLFLLFVALAVRLYNLTYHSLWFDEVMSTVWAGRPAGEIWRVGLALVEDKHPPLYYLLLHGWTAVFGSGDAAVRGLGVVIGALAVLPAYGIGSRLGGHRAGIFGALLLALNPFLVWYSQEARMFMPATTFVMVGLWGVSGIGDWGPGVRGRPPGRKLLLAWLACVLGFTAALYSYLFSAFMLPVAGVWVLLGWWAERGQPGSRARLGAGLSALLVVALLFLPLARSAWSVSGAESAPGQAFAGMWPALAGLLRIYAFGWPHWPAAWAVAATAGAGLLLPVGLWARTGRVGRASGVTEPPVGNAQGQAANRAEGVTHEGSEDASSDAFGGERLGGGLLLAWLAAPVLIGGLLLARDRTVFAESRYFIFLAPALCLAWGRALAWLMARPYPGRGAAPFSRPGGRPGGPMDRTDKERAWSRLRVGAGTLALAAVLGTTLLALPADWTAANRREAWREAAAFVAAHAGPRDAILVQADYVHVAFQRYFKGPQPVFFPFTGLLSDPAQVASPLEGLADFDAVWVVQAHDQDFDPQDLVAGWFGARFPLITEAFPQGIAIHGYAQHYRTGGAPAGTQRVDAVLGGMKLLAYAAGPRALPARDDVYHPPSNWIHVTTYWAPAAGPIAGANLPVIRLVDAGGQVWGESLSRSNDALHIWNASRWLPGEAVRADTDVNLNPVTPPGAYRLVVEAPGAEGSIDLGPVTIAR